jgi:uncharacterized protein
LEEEMTRLGIVLAGLAAAVAAGCGGGGGGGSEVGGSADRASLAAAYQPAPGDPAPTGPGITVVGTGSAKAVPDVTEWSFGVRSEADSASAAMSENAAATRRVIDALRAAGVDRDDLRTEQVSLYPRMSEDGHIEGGQGVLGYTASNTVHVTVKGVDRAGAIVDAAVEAGANEVYGPSLRVSESDEEYAEAVDAAFDDARAKAEAIAAKAGLTLGTPVAVVEGGGGGPIAYGESAAALDAAVPIEAGSQQIQAFLTVTFAVS